MKRATSTPAGLNVKKITAYLKGQAKNRNAVRITCQGGSVYIITGYAAFKLPAVLYRDVIQPVTMQDAPADGVTIVSSDAGFVVNDPHQLTAAQMFQKFSACKEEVKRTSILQEVEAKGKVWGTFRMFRNGSRPIMINSEYDAFVDHHEFVYHASNSPFAPILATDTVDPKKPAATKKAAQASAQPAPDALRKAEREAKAAFLAVPETDRKGQAAALDAWRKTRKAVEDAKQAPAAVAVPDEAPVKQLDFESIAAGLLA